MMSDTESGPVVELSAEQVSELRNRADELERRIADLQREAQARLVLAELKAEAVRAGMIDLDGLKLLNLDQIKLDAHGQVDGAAGIMSELRRTKPWLFGGSSSSSSSSKPPPAHPPRQKMASEMTDEEYRAARAALLKRRS
jgi:hypothetical protein